MKTWEAIFLLSPVNHGYYDEDGLPHLLWHWPKQTWLQNRMGHLRERRAGLPLKKFPTMEDARELPTM